MGKTKYRWTFGETSFQVYYETETGDGRLLVFADRKRPDAWLGQCNHNMLLDKARNDRQRQEQGLPPGSSPWKLKSVFLLHCGSPEEMIEKVEWCHEHNVFEI